MRYSDYIHISEGFQSSVNLEFDLNNTDKVCGYIPTEQSVTILGQFLKSFYYDNSTMDRATVFVGPYGRGKSHLLLLLSALTSMDVMVDDSQRTSVKKDLLDVCNRISTVNKEVGALAKSVVDSDIRTLPVIINNHSNDITQMLLIAISEALTRAGLDHLLPKTYFDAALSIVDRWKESYPDAMGKLNSALKKEKSTFDQMYIGLKRFDHKSYELFCKCYPQVAAGTSFNPLSNTDVVKLYVSVAHALAAETKYKGINIIFDEFSKFLEANLDKSNMLNFMIIQDLAEAAVRSGKNQIHFTCVTHKDFVDYSTSDSFKTVEGRFNKIYFIDSAEQSYELISNAIVKNSRFSSFLISHHEEFSALAASPTPNVFDDLSAESYENTLIKGCFPLAPMSSFSLLRISELVGQNERTLFTFLAQDNPYTLATFLKIERDHLDLLTVDSIYDYFSDLFKKEVFNPRVHSVWTKTESAIRQVKDYNALRILKAIAVINIISDERYKPVPAHIKASLSMSDKDFDISIRILEKQHILSHRESSEFVLLTANGIDVKRNIERYVDSKLSKINIGALLNEICEWGPVIPREHNDRFCISRYFKEIFMDSEVFLKYSSADQLLVSYPADGLIIHIIETQQDTSDAIQEKLNSFSGNPEIIVCHSAQLFTNEYLIKNYAAASLLKSEISSIDDPHYYDEIVIFEEDYKRQIQTLVSDMYAPNSPKSSYYNCNGALSVSSQKELGRTVSEICNRLYNLTPRVNNEMVNKNVLNSQNIKGRDLTVAWLLQHSSDAEIPCMEGYGPEVSIFKSTFKATGLDHSAESNDPGINAVLNEVKRFVKKCEKSKLSLSVLYRSLLSAPYGMRKGLIPLFIAYVLREYKENTVLYYKNREIELSPAVINNFNSDPENYYLLVEAGTDAREIFLGHLMELFHSYRDTKTPGINNTYSVVRCMQNWLRTLPDYTKKYMYYLCNGQQKPIPDSIRIIRQDLLKYEVNAREMLFGKWVPYFSPEGNYEVVLDIVQEAKTHLEDHLKKTRHELILELTDLFSPGYHGGLTHAVASWYSGLSESTRSHIFPGEARDIMRIAGGINSFDDEKLLDDLVSACVYIAIEDWNDSTFNQFISTLSESLHTINAYKQHSVNSSKGGSLLLTMSGSTINRSFSSDEITPLGKTVMKNIVTVFEEYNEAISPDEQIAILAKIIDGIAH